MAVFDVAKRLQKGIAESGKLTPIAFVTTFLPALGTFVLFFIGYPLGLWLRENPSVGAVGYAAGVIIFCGLALLPTNVIGLIGGFAFGFDFGLFLLLTAVVGASLVSFLIHGRILGGRVPDIIGNHPKARAVHEALVGQGFWRTTVIILLIRLSIIMPFALTNFIFASARVPLTAFLTGTFLGMLPRSSAVVFAGAGLSELTLEAPNDFWLIALGIAATLCSMVLISVVSKKALEKFARLDAE
jgi:uncharacterized membrane protein YdjX (TVP38/TMEM64 family)